MVLVDTSIWISHFRTSLAHLEELLLEMSVVCHPFIVGELACGNLKNRREILSLLQELPQAPVAGDDEVHLLIEQERLAGTGIGWVDVHLLASARLSEAPLWTHDKALQKASLKLGSFYPKN